MRGAGRKERRKMSLHICLWEREKREEREREAEKREREKAGKKKAPTIPRSIFMTRSLASKLEITLMRESKRERG